MLVLLNDIPLKLDGVGAGLAEERVAEGGAEGILGKLIPARDWILMYMRLLLSVTRVLPLEEQINPSWFLENLEPAKRKQSRFASTISPVLREDSCRSGTATSVTR